MGPECIMYNRYMGTLWDQNVLCIIDIWGPVGPEFIMYNRYMGACGTRMYYV